MKRRKAVSSIVGAMILALLLIVSVGYYEYNRQRTESQFLEQKTGLEKYGEEYKEDVNLFLEGSNVYAEAGSGDVRIVRVMYIDYEGRVTKTKEVNILLNGKTLVIDDYDSSLYNDIVVETARGNVFRLKDQVSGNAGLSGIVGASPLGGVFSGGTSSSVLLSNRALINSTDTAILVNDSWVYVDEFSGFTPFDEVNNAFLLRKVTSLAGAVGKYAVDDTGVYHNITFTVVDGRVVVLRNGLVPDTYIKIKPRLVLSGDKRMVGGLYLVPVNGDLNVELQIDVEAKGVSEDYLNWLVNYLSLHVNDFFRVMYVPYIHVKNAKDLMHDMADYLPEGYNGLFLDDAYVVRPTEKFFGYNFNNQWVGYLRILIKDNTVDNSYVYKASDIIWDGYGYEGDYDNRYRGTGYKWYMRFQDADIIVMGRATRELVVPSSSGGYDYDIVSDEIGYDFFIQSADDSVLFTDFKEDDYYGFGSMKQLDLNYGATRNYVYVYNETTMEYVGALTINKTIEMAISYDMGGGYASNYLVTGTGVYGFAIVFFTGDEGIMGSMTRDYYDTMEYNDVCHRVGLFTYQLERDTYIYHHTRVYLDKVLPYLFLSNYTEVYPLSSDGIIDGEEIDLAGYESSNGLWLRDYLTTWLNGLEILFSRTKDYVTSGGNVTFEEYVTNETRITFYDISWFGCSDSGSASLIGYGNSFYLGDTGSSQVYFSDDLPGSYWRSDDLIGSYGVDLSNPTEIASKVFGIKFYFDNGYVLINKENRSDILFNLNESAVLSDVYKTYDVFYVINEYGKVNETDVLYHDPVNDDFKELVAVIDSGTGVFSPYWWIKYSISSYNSANFTQDRAWVKFEYFDINGTRRITPALGAVIDSVNLIMYVPYIPFLNISKVGVSLDGENWLWTSWVANADEHMLEIKADDFGYWRVDTIFGSIVVSEEKKSARASGFDEMSIDSSGFYKITLRLHIDYMTNRYVNTQDNSVRQEPISANEEFWVTVQVLDDDSNLLWNETRDYNALVPITDYDISDSIVISKSDLIDAGWDGLSGLVIKVMIDSQEYDPPTYSYAYDIFTGDVYYGYYPESLFDFKVYVDIS